MLLVIMKRLALFLCELKSTLSVFLGILRCLISKTIVETIVRRVILGPLVSKTYRDLTARCKVGGVCKLPRKKQ